MVLRRSAFFSIVLILLAFSPFPSHQLMQAEGRYWVTPGELSFLARGCSLESNVFGATFADISINPEGWVRLIDCKDSAKFASILRKEYPTDEVIPFPYVGVEAAQSTLRWCDEFVAKLGLCPWAKQSLSRSGTVRIHIVRTNYRNSVANLGGYEDAIRSAAADLLLVTNHITDDSRKNNVQVPDSVGKTEKIKLCYEVDGPPVVDPKLAITFIVLAPSESLSVPGSSISFPEFYEFVDNLESKLFDEADAGISSTGDLVTIAGFHPQWEFLGLTNSPINFEKQSPYPTVSLVLTESIDEAGQEATERISKHNKEVLSSIGIQMLSKIFREKVIRPPPE